MEDKQHHIILVHGAGHGAWCWYKLAYLLRSAGHRVTIPDLAASGRDPRTLHDLATFADYTQPLFDIMASLEVDDKVVLVGHSLGGFNIAMAMERFPEKVALAIFVSALLPDCTNSPIYIVQQYGEQNPTLATDTMDCEITTIEGRGGCSLTSILLGPLFMARHLYQLSPPEDLLLATTLVRPSCLFQEDLTKTPPFSKDRYGSVDTAYILCRDDLQLPENFQLWMIVNYPVKDVMELDGADHMSMMSVTNKLCDALLGMINMYKLSHLSGFVVTQD